MKRLTNEQVKQVEETNKRPLKYEDYYDKHTKTWYSCRETKDVNNMSTLPTYLWFCVFVSIIIVGSLINHFTK